MPSGSPPVSSGSLDIIHVDMDAFFAAAEVLADPTLRGKPVIVGGTGDRGVVAACTYEARVYGVHSAMPSARARRLCPSAIFLPGRYDYYLDLSHQLQGILKSFTPLVEGIGLDEAFLDVSGAHRLFGDGEAIAGALRDRVAAEMGMWCSVGVARSKMVAKLASEAAKPAVSDGSLIPGRGVMVIQADDELAFLHPLPVSRLWGVGPATARRLERLGVKTVGDLASVPSESLVACVGRAAGGQLHDLSWGCDPRRVEAGRRSKSVGHEETFAKDIADKEALQVKVVRLSDGVGSRLRAAGVSGRTVTLKVRFADLSTITRSKTVARPTAAGPVISDVASGLLQSISVKGGVRLIGVSVSGLVDQEESQLELGEGAWTAASETVDAIRQRFGDRAVGVAAMAGPGGLAVKRLGDRQWGPSERVVDSPGVRENGAGGSRRRSGSGSEGGGRAAFRG